MKDAATFAAAAAQMPKIKIEAVTSAITEARNDSLHLKNIFKSATAIKYNAHAALHWSDSEHGGPASHISKDADSLACTNQTRTTNDGSCYEIKVNKPDREDTTEDIQGIAIRVVVKYDGYLFPWEAKQIRELGVSPALSSTQLEEAAAN